MMTSYDVGDLPVPMLWQVLSAHFIDEEIEAQKWASQWKWLWDGLWTRWVPAANYDVITQFVCWGVCTGPQTYLEFAISTVELIWLPPEFAQGSDTASTDHCLQAWRSTTVLHRNECPQLLCIHGFCFSNSANPSAVPTPVTPWTESGQ